MAERDSGVPAIASTDDDDFVHTSPLAAARAPEFPGAPARAESYVREVLSADVSLRSSIPPVAPHISRAKSAVAASGKSGSMRVPLPEELGAAPPRRTPARNPGEISSSRAEMIAVLRASVEEATGGTGRAPLLGTPVVVVSAQGSVAYGQSPASRVAARGAELERPASFAEETATVPLVATRVNERGAKAAGSDPAVWSAVSTVPRRRRPSPAPEASILIDGQVPALESEQLRPTHPGFVGSGPLRLPVLADGAPLEDGAGALAFEAAPDRRRRGVISVALLALAVGGLVAFGFRDRLTGTTTEALASSAGTAPLEGLAQLHELPPEPGDTAASRTGEASGNAPRVRIVTAEEAAASPDEGAAEAPGAAARGAVRFEDLPPVAPAGRAESSSRSGYTARAESVPSDGQSPALSARLSINSVPGSDVFVNGRAVGHTPLKSIAVAPGTSAIIFVHPKLGKRRTDVTLEAGQKFTLTKKF